MKLMKTTKMKQASEPDDNIPPPPTRKGTGTAITAYKMTRVPALKPRLQPQPFCVFVLDLACSPSRGFRVFQILAPSFEEAMAQAEREANIENGDPPDGDSGFRALMAYSIPDLNALIGELL
jgi:hypothetical protein